MDRQSRTGDTVLVKSREMTGRTHTLQWWLEGDRAKTTENKIHCPRYCSKRKTEVAVSELPLGLKLYTALIRQSRNLKSRYGARNRFQEPSLELSSQAT